MQNRFVAQSPVVVHVASWGQPGHVPPQSVSVSVPFRCPSEQLGVAQRPAVQTWVMQSAPAAQEAPTAQAGQLGPPQSTSVSAPFGAPSSQRGAPHTPALQTVLLQSVDRAQS